MILRHYSFPLALIMVCVLSVAMPNAFARDAAFIDPGLQNNSGGGAGSEAITVEPKAEIDSGESVMNVARRVSVFFVNQTPQPIDVIGVTVNSDGNVKSEILGDDCTKEGKIGPSSRCSVEVGITPVSPGAWSTEVLLTYKGTGRIVRAKITGKAAGQVAAEKKDMGLTPTAKEATPIDFGDVDIDGGKSVHSSLMVNDGLETITILSIDVIAAENGLEKLDQGCVVDMDLKPGESCPVTLLWKPTSKGKLSTDLIIRHSGKLGFVVIPVRGNAKSDSVIDKTDKTSSQSAQNTSGSHTPMPPTPDELEKMAKDKIPPVSMDMLETAVASSSSHGAFHLIGTVGNRVILLKPDGTTGIFDVNEDITYGNDKIAKITNVTPKGAEIFMDGKKKLLVLEAASELTAKAALEHKNTQTDKSSGIVASASSKSSGTDKR